MDTISFKVGREIQLVLTEDAITRNEPRAIVPLAVSPFNAVDTKFAISAVTVDVATDRTTRAGTRTYVTPNPVFEASVEIKVGMITGDRVTTNSGAMEHARINSERTDGQIRAVDRSIVEMNR